MYVSAVRLRRSSDSNPILLEQLPKPFPLSNPTWRGIKVQATGGTLWNSFSNNLLRIHHAFCKSIIMLTLKMNLLCRSRLRVLKAIL